METRVRRWGNSLGLRIPNAFARDLRLAPGAHVEIRVEGGRLVVSPTPRPRFTLKQLLKCMTPGNRHPDAFPPGRRGRELI